MDREKVISALKCWVNDSCVDCTKCDYYDGRGNCVKRICNDALELLKGQEARVMTLDEVKALDRYYCYLERTLARKRIQDNMR